MSSTTPRVGLYLPEDDGSEPVNVATDINDNMQRIDSSLGFVPSTSATPPSTPFNGMATYETDTGVAKFYKASVWSQLLAAGTTFLNNILLDKTRRIGIGNLTPAAVIDVIIDNVFAGPLLKFKQTAETYHRVEIDYDGFRLGGGGSLPEVRVYRPSSGTLALDAVGVTMTGGLTVAGATALSTLNLSSNLVVGGTVNSDLNVVGNITATGQGIEKTIYKATITNRASTTTLAPDPDFFFTALPNTTYFIELFMFVAGLPAADFSCNWATPSGTTGLRWSLGMAPAGTDASSTVMRTQGHQLTTNISYGTANAAISAGAQETVTITIGSTGGLVTFNWAQTTSNATATFINVGSVMRYRIVA